jgi:hypothetical protein
MENHQTSAMQEKILLFCILSASGLLVAQSASALKIQSPPSTLRMTANVSHDILLMKIQVQNQKTLTRIPTLTDVESLGSSGSASFKFIEEVKPEGGQPQLLFRCQIDNFPPKSTQVRKATLKVENESGPVEYIITNLSDPGNLDILGPASPWELSDNGGATSFDVITGDAPASEVTVSAPLAEKDGAQSIDSGLWWVAARSCECSNRSQVVNLLPHQRTKLWLCALKPSGYGEFNGTLSISALEYPSSKGVNFKVYATSSFLRLVGVAFLCASVVVSWFARTYLANRLTRDQALLGAAIQRQRLEPLVPAVDQLHGDFPSEEGDVYASVHDLLTKLATANINQQLYTTPSLPIPFQFSPRASQYTAFLGQVDTTLTVLTIVVREGLSPVADLWKCEHPNHKPDFQTAVSGMNNVFVQSTDLAAVRRQVRALLDTLKAAIGGAVAAAVVSAAPPALPSVDTLLLDIRRMSQIVWVVICFLTVLTGWVVLIARNPGFGKPADLLFCVFWGFGLPVTVLSLTPSSVMNAFSGSTMRVSAVAA